MITNFKINDRVELSPATDAWMSGDRYGKVDKIGRKYIYVLMDRSGRYMRLTPDLLTVVRPPSPLNMPKVKPVHHVDASRRDMIRLAYHAATLSPDRNQVETLSETNARNRRMQRNGADSRYLPA